MKLIPKMWRFVFPSLLLVTVNASCVTSPEKKLEEDVHSWVGTRQEDLMNYWGEADETLDVGDGARVLQYEADDTEEDVKYPCVVIFSVNQYGFVLGSKFNGDRVSCENFVKVLPEEHRNILKKTNVVILEAVDNFQSQAR